MPVNSPRPADHAPAVLPPIYPIVDLDLCRLRGRDPAALARAYAEGGARMIQLRQKSAGSGPFLALCRVVVDAVAPVGVTVIINDRADIAVMADAAGVHVGQDDLALEDVRRIIGPNRWLGLSTHTPEQVDAALEADITYLAVGPIFRTATKDTGYEARGLDLIRYAAGRGKPVVAIGGVTLDTARTAFEAGASSLAIISDLLGAADPAERVREYLRQLP